MMKVHDMIELGFENLRRTKLRTALTTLGVIIGIGALTSMVSFGTGMQRNITEAFKANDLFTSLFVTPREIDMEEIAEGSFEHIAETLEETPTQLTDSTLHAIRQIGGVEIAFPEISFPVKIQFDDAEVKTTLRALPAEMGSYKPFSELMFGEFFVDDTSHAALIRSDILEEMGVVVEGLEQPGKSAEEDTLAAKRIVHPDSIIGKRLQVVTAVVDPSRIPADPIRAFLKRGHTAFKEATTEFSICGILKKPGTFTDNRFRGGIVVPIRAAQKIPRLGFSSVWELLGSLGKEASYNSIYVRAKSIGETEPVRESLEKMGLHVFSISDQLKEIKRGFLIVDSILGAIGTIALVVAALGIVNTMVMSILERTREIGIMKAIGGSENEIKMIFFAEAGTIGVIGALFGLILGWIVTRIANFIVNSQILPEGETPLNLFYFPIWLILGAIAFSIVISLAAGLYPATRAARVDPVEALRHD